jgi:predicted kinase
MPFPLVLQPSMAESIPDTHCWNSIREVAMNLIIFIGLQASGKSTYYRAHFAATHAYVSTDRLRSNSRPERRQAQLIAQALQEGRSVVVDNTNATVGNRAPLIALGRAYGAEIVGYYFESPVSASLERNRQRTGRERVPDVAIYAAAKRLERPSYAEGFDRLYRVRMTSDAGFELHGWQDGGGNENV